MTTTETLTIGAVAFGAGIVNGALGYGFSSITVPVALLFLTNRVLNPALVLVEILLNGTVLRMNRGSLRAVWKRTMPIVAGLVPGIIAGTLVVSTVNADLLRFVTFVSLLPLILLQAAGVRRALGRERFAGFVFGNAVGVLYAATTISGPPLALALNNQGLTTTAFRAAIGLIRLAESGFTAVAYSHAGLFTSQTWPVLAIILPGAITGARIGAWLIRRMPAETFRRVCMSFDAWLVAFGIATLLRSLYRVDWVTALTFMAIVAVVDGWLLYRFFSARSVVTRVA